MTDDNRHIPQQQQNERDELNNTEQSTLLGKSPTTLIARCADDPVSATHRAPPLSPALYTNYDIRHVCTLVYDILQRQRGAQGNAAADARNALNGILSQPNRSAYQHVVSELLPIVTADHDQLESEDYHSFMSEFSNLLQHHLHQHYTIGRCAAIHRHDMLQKLDGERVQNIMDMLEDLYAYTGRMFAITSGESVTTFFHRIADELRISGLPRPTVSLCACTYSSEDH